MTEAAHTAKPTLLAAIGKRVTIRLREPSGGFRDIVGFLQSERQLINSKSELVSFSPDQIAIWREIKPLPDLAGKGAPLSLRIIELEKLSDATWPAERVLEFGKWLIRISDGYTKRANSVLPTGSAPIGEPAAEIAAAVDSVKKIYLENGLTPAFAIPLPIYAELDNHLEAAGWKLSLSTSFLIKDLGAKLDESHPEFSFEITDYPSDAWLDTQSDQRIANILRRYPAHYGTLKSGEQVLAVGRVAILGSWAIVTKLFVDPEHRGKGMAKLMMNRLMSIAIDDGATKIALQVDDENGAALALYQSMGFRFHHSSVYRVLDDQSVAP